MFTLSNRRKVYATDVSRAAHQPDRALTRRIVLPEDICFAVAIEIGLRIPTIAPW